METPVRRGLSVNGRTYSDQILQEFFPSNFPNIVIASSSQTPCHGMYDHSPTQPSPTTPSRQNFPPPVSQKTPAPKPKPKPKPVRTSISNGYSRGSSNESIDESGGLGNGALNSSGEIQGDQEEVVTSSKSRNFFKEQERKASVSSQDGFERKPSLTSLSSFDGSPSNTIKRNGSVGKPPALKPKPISIPENERGNAHLSKPPPPAPPKRSDSIRYSRDIDNGTNDDDPPALPVKSKSRSSESASSISPNYPSPPAGFSSPILPSRTDNTSVVSLPRSEINGNLYNISAAPPPRTEINGNLYNTSAAPPPRTEINGNLYNISAAPPPRTEINGNLYNISAAPPRTEINGNLYNNSLEKKDSIDEAFGSTDDLLNDLMADIDDFSAQLDAMF